MRWIVASAGLAALMTAGCSKGPQQGSSAMQMAAYDVAEPEDAPPPAGSAPAIAYRYALSYRVDSDEMAAVQQRQLAVCTRLGVARCRVASASMTAAGVGNDRGRGSTRLLIEARVAQPFIRRLDAVVGKAGGEIASRQTDAEDVTKRIIDTDARLRAKQALADRLFRLIQKADGKVGDLVAAEKAFADVQEELDAARSTQAALRQRVAMSEIAIDYVATEATGIASPITDSLRGAGRTLGSSVAAVVTFTIAGLPWVVLLAFVIWLLRRSGRRPWPWRRRSDRISPAVPRTTEGRSGEG